jgi:hypothetical protein
MIGAFQGKSWENAFHFLRLPIIELERRTIQSGEVNAQSSTNRNGVPSPSVRSPIVPYSSPPQYFYFVQINSLPEPETGRQKHKIPASFLHETQFETRSAMCAKTQYSSHNVKIRHKENSLPLPVFVIFIPQKTALAADRRCVCHEESSLPFSARRLLV